MQKINEKILDEQKVFITNAEGKLEKVRSLHDLIFDVHSGDCRCMGDIDYIITSEYIGEEDLCGVRYRWDYVRWVYSTHKGPCHFEDKFVREVARDVAENDFRNNCFYSSPSEAEQHYDERMLEYIRESLARKDSKISVDLGASECQFMLTEEDAAMFAKEYYACYLGLCAYVEQVCNNLQIDEGVAPENTVLAEKYGGLINIEA